MALHQVTKEDFLIDRIDMMIKEFKLIRDEIAAQRPHREPEEIPESFEAGGITFKIGRTPRKCKKK